MPTSEPDLLIMTGIKKSYPGVRALKGVDFTLARGEVHCLVGENGAGKSTLIRVLSGATRPDEGTIAVEGDVRRAIDPGLGTPARDRGHLPGAGPGSGHDGGREHLPGSRARAGGYRPQEPGHEARRQGVDGAFRSPVPAGRTRARSGTGAAAACPDPQGSLPPHQDPGA